MLLHVVYFSIRAISILLIVVLHSCLIIPDVSIVRMLDMTLLLRLPLSLQTVVFWLLFNFILLIYFFWFAF